MRYFDCAVASLNMTELKIVTNNKYVTLSETK